MLTTEHYKAIGTLEHEAEFNWQAWYSEKADAFNSTAKSWRNIAHTAQLDGDEDVVRMAHRNALENEALAKEAQAKAKEYAS